MVTGRSRREIRHGPLKQTGLMCSGVDGNYMGECRGDHLAMVEGVVCRRRRGVIGHPGGNWKGVWGGCFMVDLGENKGTIEDLGKWEIQ